MCVDCVYHNSVVTLSYVLDAIVYNLVIATYTVKCIYIYDEIAAIFN